MQATVIGWRCQSISWSEKLEDSFQICIEESIELAEGVPYQSRIEMLENFVQVMYEDSQKPALFLEIATVISHAGISALTTKDFLPALQAFHDCYRPIQEIRRLTRETGDKYSEIVVIENDVAFHMATASALQAIRAGPCFSCFTLSSSQLKFVLLDKLQSTKKKVQYKKSLK